MGVVKSEKVTTKTSAELKSGGIYTIPKAIVVKPTTNGEYDCLISKDNSRILCGKLGCTDSSSPNYDAAAKIDDGSCSTTAPAPPSTGTTTPPSTGSTTPPKESKRYSNYIKFNLEKTAEPNSPTEVEIENQFKDVQEYLMEIGCGRAWPIIYIQRESSTHSNPQRVVLFGDSQTGSRDIVMPVTKQNGLWGFTDQGRWQAFEGSNWCTNKFKLHEEVEDTLPKMIDDKLREFNFYSANDKGKQKVVFTDEDREEISREFDDLIKKYPEDIAFIRSVVIAKGEDKKTGEPIVRLGSYYNNANIELPFNSQMNGLGKLLDGGIIYFTVLNNEGPDYRDFKIVGGDKIPEVEFNEPEKEEIELDNYTHSHDEEMAEMNEPFEEVMNKKEQKGLSSLLNSGKVTDDLTKKQKEVLENLKKKGFKFDLPENSDIYERVKISSKEFNESIKAWRPKE